MKTNIMNGVMKLVNSVLWAILVKLILTVGLEVWVLYRETLPETVRPLEFWANGVVILVFLIALTTYRFPAQVQQNSDSLPVFPPAPQAPENVEHEDPPNFDELLKEEKKEKKKPKSLDEDIDNLKAELQ